MRNKINASEGTKKQSRWCTPVVPTIQKTEVEGWRIQGQLDHLSNCLKIK